MIWKTLVLLMVLVTFGCGGLGRSETLMEMVDVPDMPNIEWKQGPCTQSTSMCVDDGSFINLTGDVISLETALTTCNKQIEVFAE